MYCQIDGLMQKRCNSIVNALELHLSCNNLSKCLQQKPLFGNTMYFKGVLKWLHVHRGMATLQVGRCDMTSLWHGEQTVSCGRLWSMIHGSLPAFTCQDESERSTACLLQHHCSSRATQALHDSFTLKRIVLKTTDEIFSCHWILTTWCHSLSRNL